LPWIESAAKDATREKRIVETVEIAVRARERAADREARAATRRAGARDTGRGAAARPR
jgi:hypothetical protein